MSIRLLSLADASNLLNVSIERVRQLAVSGELPSQKIGNAWAVDRGAVLARRDRPTKQGRPLGARRAWSELFAGKSGVLAAPARYRRRAALQRYRMNRFSVESLVADHGAILSGVEAANEYGEILTPVVSDIYVSEELNESLPSVVAALRDPFGEVNVRVVPNNVWGFLVDSCAESDGKKLAPPLAVALDLYGSTEPRHREAAARIATRKAQTNDS